MPHIAYRPLRKQRSSRDGVRSRRIVMGRRILTLFAFPPRGPAFLVHLRGAGEREGSVRNIFRDRGPGADIGALPDGYRSHELRVGPDEGSLADRRPVLLLAVVVAGDDAGADVCARADVRVAEIS